MNGKDTMTNEERLRRTIRFEHVDKILSGPSIMQFAATYAGITQQEFAEDQVKANAAFEKTFKHEEPVLQPLPEKLFTQRLKVILNCKTLIISDLLLNKGFKPCPKSRPFTECGYQPVDSFRYQKITVKFNLIPRIYADLPVESPQYTLGEFVDRAYRKTVKVK